MAPATPTGPIRRTDKVEPQELTATIFHLLGIGHDAFFPDPTGRPHRVTEGQPLRTLLGNSPATTLRTTAGRQPRTRPGVLRCAAPEHAIPRRCSRSSVSAAADASGAGRPSRSPPGPSSASGSPPSDAGERFVQHRLRSPAEAIAPSTRALLTQEVRNPCAGRYTLSVRTRAAGTPEGRSALLDAFSFRLVIFGYQSPKKDPRQVREFASLAFRPTIDGALLSVSLAADLKSQDDGAFQLSQGVGVALVVERNSHGARGTRAGRGAYLRIEAMELTFDPRPRNDDVTV